jgi:hypothetical protein
MNMRTLERARGRDRPTNEVSPADGTNAAFQLQDFGTVLVAARK